MTEFALEYRTTREKILQQRKRMADKRERNKTRGKIWALDDKGEATGEKVASTTKKRVPVTMNAQEVGILIT